VTCRELPLGRIERMRATYGPPGEWRWAINGVHAPPDVMQIAGQAATLERAKLELAENWQKWLAWAQVARGAISLILTGYKRALPARLDRAMLRRRALLIPPGFIEPCQPATVSKPPAGPNWIHEIKYHGYRMQALRQGEHVRLFTRAAKDWSERYPLLIEAIGALRVKSCLIDGELSLCDERGIAVFDLLRRGPRNKTDVVLYAFDLLELDGTDMRVLPLEERKAALKTLLRKSKPSVQFVYYSEDDGALVFEHACMLGFEGIVSKRRGSRYISGNSDNWVKIKNPAAPAVKRESEVDWNKPRGRR
jgi:bifunctional non-homologous end joining protein LigD